MLDIKAIENIRKDTSEPKEITDKRISAFHEFMKLDLPSMKSESWRYTSSKSVDINSIEKIAKQEIKFGVGNDKGVVACTIKDAMIKHKEILMNYLPNTLSERDDKFSAMHSSFWSAGFFIYVPKNKKATVKTEINSLEKGGIFAHNIIVVEENSELDYFEEQVSVKGDFSCIRNDSTHVFIKENSNVNFHSFQNWQENITGIATWKADLSKDSSINWIFAEFGGKFSKVKIDTLFNGEGSGSKTCGVFYSNKEQHFDFTTDAYHNVPNTNCDILVKGALDGNSSSVYRGKIKILKEAQQTNSYLSDHSLMLSEGSISNSIPSLEIDANDVKASHGATIGKPDEEEVFYLMARGLNRDEAQKLIISGYFSPVLDKIKDVAMKQKIESAIEEKGNKDDKMFDAKKIREDFPILKKKVHGKDLVYLDNAATTQKPQQVIDAISNYYSEHNANIHRGVHQLSQEASDIYEEAHKKAGKFVNAKSPMEETIFVRNATEASNLVAYGWAMHELKPGDEIISTVMEHHANIVPWQFAREKGIKVNFVDVTDDGRLNIEDLKKKITAKTKLVSCVHASNVVGTINDVKEIGKIAHDNKALFMVDGAQSVPHMPVDVKKIDCDFLVFSGHKMLAPMGTGALYAKKEILEKMHPFLGGGDMIREVKLEESRWNDLPWKFEAGTPDVGGAAGFSAAIDYLNKLGMDNVRKHEKELLKYGLDKFSEFNGVDIYGPTDPEIRGGLITFNLKGIHPHDVAGILDSEYGVAIRSGMHCAQPLTERLGQSSTCRASFYIYNTEEEIDVLMEGLKKVKQIFGK